MSDNGKMLKIDPQHEAEIRANLELARELFKKRDRAETLVISPEGDQVQVPCVAVAAYAIGDHKEMTPGAIRNWRYTENQEQAMAAVERGLWVKFVKMYRLPGGQLVADPWINIAAAYVEPTAQPTVEEDDLGADILAGTPQPSRHGTSWSHKDTEYLRMRHAYASRHYDFQAKKDIWIKNIARRLGRSEIAIVYKLHAMGLEPTR